MWLYIYIYISGDVQAKIQISFAVNSEFLTSQATLGHALLLGIYTRHACLQIRN